MLYNIANSAPFCAKFIFINFQNKFKRHLCLINNVYLHYLKLPVFILVPIYFQKKSMLLGKEYLLNIIQ